MNFLPANYEVPKTSGNYLKFEKGANKFRVVSSAIIGYVYWNNENKPVRLEEKPESIPSDIRYENGKYSIKHFWAFTVIDRADGKVKICEITQSSIQQQVKAIVDNEDWGDPKSYDINVTRTGDSLETKYTVQPSPHKPLTDEEVELVKNTYVNLNALYVGLDPFSDKIDLLKIEEAMNKTKLPEIAKARSEAENFDKAFGKEELPTIQLDDTKSEDLKGVM